MYERKYVKGNVLLQGAATEEEENFERVRDDLRDNKNETRAPCYHQYPNTSLTRRIVPQVDDLNRRLVAVTTHVDWRSNLTEFQIYVCSELLRSGAFSTCRR